MEKHQVVTELDTVVSKLHKLQEVVENEFLLGILYSAIVLLDEAVDYEEEE